MPIRLFLPPARLMRRVVITIGLILLASVGPSLLTGLILGGIGQWWRDRNEWTMLMMYIPLMPLGLFAIAHDLAAEGRALPKVRYALAIAGLVSVGWAGWWECGHGTRATGAAPAVTGFTLVQWNVWFGGGDTRTLYSWDSLSDDIRAAGPDIIVLNEAPPNLWLDELMLHLGPDWRWTGRETWTKDLYRCQLAVCSRWPLKLDEEVALSNGHGMIVSLRVRDRPLRILVADGRSDIAGPRTPLLHDVLRTCATQRNRGEPIDIITGDFNSISRSVGFDLFNTDYALASRASPGAWRGTWPMPLPIFDIDHVWAARDRLSIDGCTFLANSNSDHRGQAARLRFKDNGEP